MGKLLLFLLFMGLQESLVANSTKDTIRNVLVKAYLEEDSLKSIKTFREAQKLIQHDSDLGHFYYFKYFRFYRYRNSDSFNFYLKKSLPLLKQTGQYARFLTLRNNMFWDKVDASEYDKAVQIGNENILLGKKYKDSARTIGFYGNLAVAYHDIGQYEKGIEVAKAGIQLYDPPKFKDQISNCINAIGICFDDWGKPDSAIYYHRKNLIFNPSSTDLTQTYNNLGNTFSKMKEFDSAIKYISKAVEIDLSRRGNPYKLATSINNLGRIKLKLEYFPAAKKDIDTAFKFAVMSDNTEKLRDVYFNYADYYALTNQYDSAYKYLNLYHKFKDSMLNNERISIINNMEANAREAELNEDILIAKAETNQRNLWIVVICALLLVSLLMAYQLYLKRKRVAKEAKLRLQNERLRISRDLHDNLGAELTYISSIIDQRAFGIKDPEKKAELEQLSSSSRHAMDQMRETIWAIQTNEISVKKFAQKVSQTSKKYAESANTLLKINTSGDNVLLPPSLVIVLLRICQESINNAVKYARGTTITMDFNVEDPNYSLEIKDNGVGFDQGKVTRGYGLNNMKERMEEIKGEFVLESKIDKGTRIILKGKIPKKYD